MPTIIVIDDENIINIIKTAIYKKNVNVANRKKINNIDLNALADDAVNKDNEIDLDKLIDSLYVKLISSFNENTNIIQFMEKALIARAYKSAQGNKLQTARVLGINRSTLQKKLVKYGIKISTGLQFD